MTSRGPASLARLAREPLVHFFVLGALLFALDAARGGRGDDAPPASNAAAATREPAADAPLVVTRAVTERLAAQWQEQRGAAPSPDELALLVDAWLRDEVLYREGLARGLDKDDEAVRTRVAAKMGLVLDAQLIARAPSEAELRAYYDAHAARWARGARLDFTHVFVRAADGAPGAAERARAEALLAQLREGAAPDGLGDVFSGGRRYRGREIEDLARQFGDAFARGLDALEEGAWALLPSRFGLHLVRVDRRARAEASTFAAARLDVLRAWELDERARLRAEAVDALLARRRVVRE